MRRLTPARNRCRLRFERAWWTPSGFDLAGVIFPLGEGRLKWTPTPAQLQYSWRLGSCQHYRIERRNRSCMPAVQHSAPSTLAFGHSAVVVVAIAQHPCLTDRPIGCTPKTILTDRLKSERVERAPGHWCALFGASLLPGRDRLVVMPARHQGQVDTRYVDEQGRRDEEHREPEAPVPMSAHPVRAGLLSLARMRSFLMVRVSTSSVGHECCISSSGAGAAPLWPLRSSSAALFARS